VLNTANARVLVVLCPLFLFCQAAHASPTGPATEPPQHERSTYTLVKGAMSAAGGIGHGSAPAMTALWTLGQPLASGPGTSAEYVLAPGFWAGSSTATGVSEEESTGLFRDVLLQNHPNPFNPNTVISYEVSAATQVTLEIYNVQGRLIRTLTQGPQEPGVHEVLWDGRDSSGQEVASGVYLYRVRIGEFESVKKMVLLK
jgi:hypothetical protein